MEVMEMKDHVQSMAHSENDTSLFLSSSHADGFPIAMSV